MAQPLAIIFTSILQRYFNQINPHPFNLVDGLRTSFAPKQVLLAENLVLDEYLADLWNESPEAVRRKWKGGMSWATWDRNSSTPEESVLTEVQSGHLQVPWRQVIFDILRVDSDSIRYTGEPQSWYALAFDGPDDSVARAFIHEVSAWNDLRKNRGNEGMFVFNQGFWKKDQNLADSIAAVHRDDLVLDDKVLNGLQRDVESFFNSQSLYEDLKVVWKRGLLLTGPPGNGKSHTIKLLVKNSKATCLYVRSTRGSSRHGIGTEECIAAIFKKARKTTPCLLVLEDLDSLIEASTRTFFLNELDGFAVNNGVLILASSNNPELIDPAVNRPSRFDVIYSFEPPTYELRCRYATKWLTKISELRGNRSLSSPLQDPEELAKRIAQKTEGFSYAYMKELFLSFLFGLAHSGGKNADNLETQLFLQIRHLREQLANISDQKKKEKDTDAGVPKRTSSPFRLNRGMFSRV